MNRYIIAKLPLKQIFVSTGTYAIVPIIKAVIWLRVVIKICAPTSFIVIAILFSFV